MEKIIPDKVATIVFIGYAPLTEKSANDFFINDLIKDKIHVEYWDLTSMFFPGLESLGRSDDKLVKVVHSRMEIRRLINAQDEHVVFFVNFPFEYRVLWLFRMLTAKNAKIYLIAKGMIPMPDRKSDVLFKQLFSLGVFKKILNVFSNRIALFCKHLGLIKPFDRIYFAGIDAIKIAGLGHPLDKAKAELISINSSDYDKYLSILNTPSIIKDRYILFLDEYLPYHPDFLMFDIKPVDSLSYYKYLNFFFEKIEQKFGLKVVIAAHPKAKMYHTKNFFNNRSVIFDKTSELVKNAEFVLAHMSTAISFSVLFEKPTVFLLSDDILKDMPYQADVIYHMAKCLNAQVLNINSISSHSDVNVDLSIDANAYQKYKFRYLTSAETRNVQSYAILKNTI